MYIKSKKFGFSSKSDTDHHAHNTKNWKWTEITKYEKVDIKREMELKKEPNDKKDQRK